MALHQCVVALTLVLALAYQAASQTTVPLPPVPYSSPAPSASLSNQYCDLSEYPGYYDATACSLSKWGGSRVVLPSGSFYGTTFSSLESTRVSNISIVVSGITVDLSGVTAPVVPAFIIVGTGLCPTLATAITCLGGVNSTTGAINAAACSACANGSVSTVVVPYGYLSASITQSNLTAKTLPLARSTAPWTSTTTQLFLWVGSLSSAPVSVTVSATATLTYTAPRNLPPSTPGSMPLAAGPARSALSVGALMALALTVLISLLHSH